MGPRVGGLSRARGRALTEGGALRVGLGFGGEGGAGLTLVLYLRGAGAAATEAWGVAEASVGPMAGLPWAAEVVAGGAGTASVAAAVVARGVAVAVVGPGLESLAMGGQDCLTLGQKLCPPRVFTMAGLEKERR